MKKFTINCDFNGKKVPVTFFIGNPAVGSHPLAFQSSWLGREKGGIVPEKLMNSFAKLKEIADANKVRFEDLCTYVIDEVNNAEEVIKNLENTNKNINEQQK